MEKQEYMSPRKAHIVKLLEIDFKSFSIDAKKIYAKYKIDLVHLKAYDPDTVYGKEATDLEWLFLRNGDWGVLYDGDWCDYWIGKIEGEEHFRMDVFYTNREEAVLDFGSMKFLEYIDA